MTNHPNRSTKNLTARAASLFPSWRDASQHCAALQLVAAYAAQNPGLEYGNYCSGWRDKDGRAAYFSESRRITRDLRRVRDAMHGAYSVTDDDVIEAAMHAFSGRLSVNRRADGALVVDYCTGQYWPTEYRAACAAVIEAACQLAYRRAVQQSAVVAA